MPWGKNQYEIDGETGASYPTLESAIADLKALVRRVAEDIDPPQDEWQREWLKAAAPYLEEVRNE